MTMSHVSLSFSLSRGLHRHDSRQCQPTIEKRDQKKRTQLFSPRQQLAKLTDSIPSFWVEGYSAWIAAAYIHIHTHIYDAICKKRQDMLHCTQDHDVRTYIRGLETPERGRDGIGIFHFTTPRTNPIQSNPIQYDDTPTAASPYLHQTSRHVSSRLVSTYSLTRSLAHSPPTPPLVAYVQVLRRQAPSSRAGSRERIRGAMRCVAIVAAGAGWML
jgi:hypothetical protein